MDFATPPQEILPEGLAAICAAATNSPHIALKVARFAYPEYFADFKVSRAAVFIGADF